MSLVIFGYFVALTDHGSGEVWIQKVYIEPCMELGAGSDNVMLIETGFSGL